MLAGALEAATRQINAVAAATRRPPFRRNPPFIEVDKIVKVL
jgi:hypothetical protein